MVAARAGDRAPDARAPGPRALRRRDAGAPVRAPDHAAARWCRSRLLIVGYMAGCWSRSASCLASFLFLVASMWLLGGRRDPAQPRRQCRVSWRRSTSSSRPSSRWCCPRASRCSGESADDRSALLFLHVLVRSLAAVPDRGRHLRRHLHRRHSRPVGDHGGVDPDLLHLQVGRQRGAGADRRHLPGRRLRRLAQRHPAQHSRRAVGDRHRRSTAIRWPSAARPARRSASPPWCR